MEKTAFCRDSKHPVSPSKIRAEQVLTFGDNSKTRDAEFNVLLLYKILRLLFVWMIKQIYFNAGTKKFD